MSSTRIVPYPISANANEGISSTKKKEAPPLYYSKFLAIYYIDLMYNFIDTFSNCCIGILGVMNNLGYIKIPVLFNSTILNKLIKLNEKIREDRYVYVEKLYYKTHYVDAKNEVLAINFLEKKRNLSDFMENGSYYKELRNIICTKRGDVENQFTYILGIVNNAQLNDDIKEQKIQEYIDKKNKRFASVVDSALKFIPLESIENKLKSIEKIIVTLERCLNDNWSSNGKKLFDEYKRYKIERKETEGGKRKRNKRRIKGGIFGNFFSRFSSRRVAQTPVDYIAIVNKYKNYQTKKLKETYNLIEEIVFYTLHCINVAKIEYRYLEDYNSRYQKKEKGVFKLMKLKNTEQDYLFMLSSPLQYNVDHNFKILKRRYTELENTLSMSFPDEQEV